MDSLPLLAYVLAGVCLLGTMIMAAIDVNKHGSSAEYGVALALYVLALLCVPAMCWFNRELDAPAAVWLAGVTAAIALLLLAQKVYYFANEYSLVFDNSFGDFGFTLVDGVTDMTGKSFVDTKGNIITPSMSMPFDNTEILEEGQTQGFSISMYLGLNYGPMEQTSTQTPTQTPGRPWNAKNAAIRVPLFVRGDVMKKETSKYGKAVVDKSPLIWLVLDKAQPNDGSVSVPFIPRFEVEFNHTQAPIVTSGGGTGSADGEFSIGENSCRVVDDLTARCTFFKDSATFDAYDDAQNLRIDGSLGAPAQAKRLKHVAFVFEEVFAPGGAGGNSKLAKDHVTRVSVYVGARLKQTHTFPGTVRVSSSSVSVLPNALFSDGDLASTNAASSTFLASSRMGFVRYYPYPLGSDQIRELAGRNVPLDITNDGSKKRVPGNGDNGLAPLSST